MPRSLMLVFSDPTSAAEEANFNRWYTDKHLPDLVRIDGIVAATRYRLDKSVEPMPGIQPDRHGYLAIYELEAETPEQLAGIVRAMGAAMRAGRADLSPTLDLMAASASFAVPISARLVAPAGDDEPG